MNPGGIDVLDWLMDNAGPAIRYRTARELIGMDNCSTELKALSGAIADMPEVTKCIENIRQPNNAKEVIHGSSDICFENAMARAINLGLHKGMHQLDEVAKPWINYVDGLVANKFTENYTPAVPHPRKCFEAIIVAGLLLKAGYDDEAVISFMLASLKDLSEFTGRRDYDLYMADTSSLKGMPNNFKGRPVIKQELYMEKGYLYPLIYDIVGLSGLYALGIDDVDRSIGNVISCILTPEFHRSVVHGYGVLVTGPRKYYGMGWDPKAPGFFNIDSEIRGNQLLYMTYQYAPYPDAVKTSWFSRAMEHLESFCTEKGSYRFPSKYLPEATSYAVTGGHMGLGENRRNKSALEVESTFWMMKVKRLAGLG